MSTGHPGICYEIMCCIKDAGRKYLTEKIARIHITKRISPNTLCTSYRYLHREYPIIPDDEVKTIQLSGQEYHSITLPFETYDRIGRSEEEKDFLLVFTDDHIEKGFCCAAVSDDGEVIASR